MIADTVVAVLLLMAFCFAIKGMIKNKKNNGGNQCNGNCSHCNNYFCGH